MSITFGGIAVSDRVTIAASASTNNLTAFTWLFWCYPHPSAGAKRLVSKQQSAGGTQRHAVIVNTGMTLSMDVQRVTADVVVTTSNLLALDTWQCLAGTYDETDGGRFFLGTLNTPVGEMLYTTRTIGSGATEPDANPLYVANRDTFLNAFDGKIAIFAYVARRMTLAEILLWQEDTKHGAYESHIARARVFMRFGRNGLGTQVDLTGNGNHGTVTGSIVGQMLPIVDDVRRAYWQAQAAGTYNAAWNIAANSVFQPGAMQA